MMGFRKYEDLEPLRRLKNRGRELIGKIILFTEKRDGQCVSLWRDDIGKLHISSHNQEEADEDIQKRMQETHEYSAIYRLLTDQKDEYNKNFEAYGELLLTVSPTRIEPRRKHIHWILFDIYDCDDQRYLSYEQIYQLAYSYHIPIVRVIDRCIPSNIEELENKVKETLKWCKRHRKEGTVIKCYSNQIFAKEKINLPKLPKIEKPDKLTFPPMDEHTIMKALQHSYDEVMQVNCNSCESCDFQNESEYEECLGQKEKIWRDKKITMPIVAKHMAVEGREHNYSTPHNIYQIYLNTPLIDIISKNASDALNESEKKWREEHGDKK